MWCGFINQREGQRRAYVHYLRDRFTVDSGGRMRYHLYHFERHTVYGRLLSENVFVNLYESYPDVLSGPLSTKVFKAIR